MEAGGSSGGCVDHCMESPTAGLFALGLIPFSPFTGIWRQCMAGCISPRGMHSVPYLISGIPSRLQTRALAEPGIQRAILVNRIIYAPHLTPSVEYQLVRSMVSVSIFALFGYVDTHLCS